MDSWSENQLAKMEAGGNARMRAFFKVQKFPAGLGHRAKYDNIAADQYREYVLAAAKGLSPSPVPFIGYKERAPPVPTVWVLKILCFNFVNSLKYTQAEFKV